MVYELYINGSVKNNKDQYWKFQKQKKVFDGIPLHSK